MGDAVARAKRLIVECVRPQLTRLGHSPEDLPDEFDLRAEGVIDSLGFVQLLAALEDRLGSEIDITDLPPESLTVLGTLAAHISAPHGRA